MKGYDLVMKSYGAIFKRFLVFSRSDEQVLLQVRHSLLVLPGTADD